MKQRDFKRICVISDFHGGHNVGLTPPSWQYKITKHDITKRNKYARIQSECYNQYTSQLDKFKPFDMCFDLADNIDGRGEKSGGTELITSDRDNQVKMAIECIEYIEAKKHAFVYGTPYHTGQLEDWENRIADHFKSKIGAHEWINVNGVVFDLKHKIGSSSIPHGRGTALGRDILWNSLWAEMNAQPKADIFLRGHTHYYQVFGNSQKKGFICPALQAMGSKYGSRECSGIVDFGFLVFDVYNNGRYVWHENIVSIQAQQAKATVL